MQLGFRRQGWLCLYTSKQIFNHQSQLFHHNRILTFTTACFRKVTARKRVLYLSGRKNAFCSKSNIHFHRKLCKLNIDTEKHYNSFVYVDMTNVSPIFTLLFALFWSPPHLEKDLAPSARCCLRRQISYLTYEKVKKLFLYIILAHNYTTGPCRRSTCRMLSSVTPSLCVEVNK